MASKSRRLSRRARRRCRRRADRQGRGLRLRLLQARRDVRTHRRRRRAAPLRRHRHAGRAVRADDDHARSTRAPQSRDRRRAPSTRTCSSSRSARSSTPLRLPVWSKAGHEFYTEAGAFALRDVLAAFEGGRVVVGVTSTPFKCPPAPSECALMTHDSCWTRGLRDGSDVSLVMPLRRASPAITGGVGGELLGAFERARYRVACRTTGASRWTPTVRCAVLSDGSELPYDLFLGVPKHRAPDVVLASGMRRRRLDPGGPAHAADSFPDVYAVGRRHQRRHPKAGAYSPKARPGWWRPASSRPARRRPTPTTATGSAT